MDGFSKTLKNKAEARAQVREDVYKWYLAMTGGDPKQQCEDTKPHDNTTLWWLEPLVPDVENPLVIEQEKGDGQWTIRIEPLVKKVQVFQ